MDELTGPIRTPFWRKPAVLGAIVIVLLGLVYFSPLREYLSRWQEWARMLRRFGFWAPVIFTGAVMLLVSVGFPRLAFCFIAGSTFGFWQGLLWAQLGTLAGTYIVFLVARSKADWARNYVERRGSLKQFVRRQGIPGVILARQLPVPSLLINLACGLVSFKHREFLIGTVIGQLPEAIPCTLIGAGLLRASFAQSAGYIGLAVGVAVLLFLCVRRVRGRSQPATRSDSKVA
jgi:uncharacterized membrane protein YdjX (TVP38/TMEM64 family)